LKFNKGKICFPRKKTATLCHRCLGIGWFA